MRRAFVVMAINDDLHIVEIYKTVATLHHIRNTFLSWTMKSVTCLFEYMVVMHASALVATGPKWLLLGHFNASLIWIFFFL